ncbi:hypothetical protein DBR47_00815 [Paucibacter sp. KBW04]|uniref:TraR/DksA C4-type zinc finger protein n=1 Tax=Paucibacter sp. KBW04 TaxID=2153361 RepID=UPI000F578493|nr:TraR/DksA C4-type zinc finger protein [Paucibacter sp. KBW04]RQO63147.1 hypothetical protein DBR47_00815 [Paucibacter sp. KBW04]
MSDLIDRANDQSEMLLRLALEHQRRTSERNRRPATGGGRMVSAETCTGDRCGEQIPEERRRLLPGVQLCVDCQARLELLEKGQGHHEV